jgi:hypothetical protein
MNSDLLSQAEARMSSAQAELDQALLDGQDTTKAREYLTSTQAEVARIEGAMASEQARVEAGKHQDMDARAAELVEATKAKLVAEFEAMGFSNLPAFAIPTGQAISLLRANDRLAEEREAAGRRWDDTRALRTRIDDIATQMRVITTRRAQGDERASDAAQYALLQADHGAAKDLEDRMRAVPPEATEAARWAADANQQWMSTVGMARSGLLDAATQQAEAKLIAVAKARLVPFGGVCPSRYAPSVMMQKVLSGRAY